jgi:MscS family membrane protein
MTNRRIYETIGVRYSDLAEMTTIIDQVTEMLLQHEDIDSEQTMIVNFNQFSASSLDFFIYTFTKTTRWVEFHKIKQDVLLKVAAVIEANGAEIAFPTSTIHMETLPEALQQKGQ